MRAIITTFAPSWLGVFFKVAAAHRHCRRVSAGTGSAAKGSRNARNAP